MSALQAHRDHRTGERPLGALAGVLLPPGKPGLELGRVGEQPLIAVAHRRDVRLDGVREPRLDLAVADPAGAIALLDGGDRRTVGEGTQQRDQRAVSGCFGCSGGVESVTIRRICLRMSSGSAISGMALP